MPKFRIYAKIWVEQTTRCRAINAEKAKAAFMEATGLKAEDIRVEEI